MKKLGAILVMALLCCGFIPQHKAARSSAPQKSISELYTEAVKALTIHQDTLRAIANLEAIFKQDSNQAPALYLLARITPKNEDAVAYAKRAYESDTTNRYYLEGYGKALLRTPRYNDAIPVFQKIICKSTELQDYHLLSVLLDGVGRTSEAVAVVDSSEVRLGRNPYMARMRQYYLLKMGQTLAAEIDAKRAIELAPYIAENHIALAKIYAMTGRDSLALVSYRDAIAIDTLAIDPWLSLAEHYEIKRDRSSYLSILLRVFASKELMLENKIQEWKSLRGNKQDYRTYFSLYDSLIKLLRIHYPESKEVLNLYIDHLIASGNAEEASRLSKLIVKGPSPTLDDFNLVIAIDEFLGRPDSVSHYIEEGLKHFPNNTHFLMQRGYFASERKDYDNALKAFSEALINTDDKIQRGKICQTIGNLGFQFDDMKVCYKAYKEALKCFDKNDTLRSNVYASLGDIEHQRNNMKACYKAYNKALKCFIDNAHVLNNFAYYLSLEERNLEEALVMATRANELSENNPTFLDTKAWVLYKLGRYAEAKKVMQRAISLDRSKSPEYPLHYGDILHALGQDFMAKEYWRKALERGAAKEEIEKRIFPEQPKEKQ